MTGRYRLVESIGQGGMGRVWRAADEILDRPVAIKEIRIDGLDAEDTRTRRERTLREARATARTDHPNVVRVYDVVDEGERLWIVMELVAGRSLERLITESGPLNPAETARIGLGLVAALRQVHERGVLHRDIKPGNVLVEEQARRVVLTDFGIAAIQDAKALTMVGMLVGSPDYMAPERISGRPQGPPSDLWSLGATLCAALGGRSPFSRDTTLATLHAVLYEEPELPASAGPLTEVLTSLLRKEPETRPGLAELESALYAVAFPTPTPTVAVGVADAPGEPGEPGEPGRSGDDGGPEEPPGAPEAVAVADTAWPEPPAPEDAAEVRTTALVETTEPVTGESPVAERLERTAAGPRSPAPEAAAPTPEESRPTREFGRRTGPRTPNASTEAASEAARFEVRSESKPAAPVNADARTELRPAPTGQAPRRRRTGVLVAVALVTVGAVVAVVIALNSGGSPGDDKAKGGTTTPSASSSPTVEGTSRPRSLPPGARKEAGGFAWVTPDGWRRDVKTGAEVHYTSPDGKQELVAKSSLARGDLMETWQTSEQNAHQGQAYRKIRLEETTFRGYPAVVWEYTFTLQGVPWHAQLLGFNEKGKSYQINTWYQPDMEEEALQTYESVKDSFTLL
ncbi:serine/threonine protein kinase [Streptomyces sp. NBRC 14336]|uniref:serine/threonine-protein kinase n=1 Tax=Streptomyces sp. NBRC 14336 TaxID=3030992 RepID=UPI0025546437|nr:serine/threonine protein kinase [Streptomyces sp. NBRC 14336]WBO78010.1 protein kinase [Streptomyces sp. SBE_14.2]